MAKKKGRRRRQGMFSKVINIGLTLLSISRPLFLLFRPGGFSPASIKQLISEATFGLMDGGFNLQTGLAFYAPAGGAIAIGTVLKFIRKKFPVR